MYQLREKVGIVKETTIFFSLYLTIQTFFSSKFSLYLAILQKNVRIAGYKLRIVRNKVRIVRNKLGSARNLKLFLDKKSQLPFLFFILWWKLP